MTSKESNVRMKEKVLHNNHRYQHLLLEHREKTPTDGIIVIDQEQIIKIKHDITVDLKYNEIFKYFTDDAHNVYLPKLAN